MSLYDAIAKAVEDGAKIRRVLWQTGEFIRYVGDGRFEDGCGEPYVFTIGDETSEWEVAE